MKKGEIIFIIFASLWAILLISSAIVVQDYPLGARIIVILIAFFPLGLYSIIKSVKRSNKKSEEYLVSKQKYRMRDDVAKALSIFKISTFGHSQDIKNAEKILHLGEKVLIVLPANYITISDDKNNKNNDNLQGIAILTDKRFIFNYKFLTNKLTEEVFLSDICFINLVEISKKRGYLEIHTNAKKYYIFLYYKQKMMCYARDLFIWAKNNAENINSVLNENSTKYPQTNLKITEQNKIQTYNEEITKKDVLSTNKVTSQSEKQAKTLVNEENNSLTDTKTVTNLFSDDDYVNNGTPLWLLHDDENSNSDDDLLYQGLREAAKYEQPQQNINSPSPQSTNIKRQPQDYNAGIQNDFRILKESYSLMESTNDLDTFFSRYKLCNKLILDTVDLHNQLNHNVYIYKLKGKILHRSFQNECKDVSKLKTQKAQLSHWEKYMTLLKKYESNFKIGFQEEYENIIQDVQNKITFLSNKNNALTTISENSLDVVVPIKANSQVVEPQIAQDYISNDQNLITPFYNFIPKEIVDLLWFSNGPLQNYTSDYNELSFDIMGHIIHIKTSAVKEPSAIDVNLSLSKTVAQPTPLDYYPSYEGLTPQQRTAYLNWLIDITNPIDIGYVFIFYYGLERHLLFGNAESALNTIFILRQYHTNKSFLSYSGDAIVLFSLYTKRLDLLKKINFDQLSNDVRLLVAAFVNQSFSPKDIIIAHKNFGFDNNRYINNEPDLFLSTLETLLIEKYKTLNFPVSLDDFVSVQGTIPLVLANYSLLPEQRFLNMPDITTSFRVRSEVNALLVKTHETVKAELQEQRKKVNKSQTTEADQNNIAEKKFSDEEQIFFNSVYENFKNAGLNPALIQASRLSSGIFNVEYVEEGYIGKVQISTTKESYRVIKQGAKRATRVFDNLIEAEQFINEKSGYSIEHIESMHIYFMQYFIGQKVHNDNFSSLQELIDTIPRWVRYVKYMKRNYR